MNKLVIEGGVKLNGEVSISGFKNAALPIITASLLAADKSVIENIPLIKDVYILKNIIETLGGKVHLSDDGVMTIDATNVENKTAPYELAKQLRASYYLAGVALGRFKGGSIVYPGGCDIGARPIDLHIKGFEALGADVKIDHGIIKCNGEGLKGTNIYLDFASVGATINIMLAAVLAKGNTIIENAAKEPHIVDTANFLNSMGANIRGAGTDLIKISGVEKLHGCTYSIIPDMIEAGTYMVAAAATGGDVLVKDVIPKHLEAVIAKLREMGVEVREYDNSVRVRVTRNLKNVNIKTLTYPGLATDLQQPMAVLLSTIKGTSMVTETVFEARFKYVDELKRMGANIKVDGKTAVIKGIDKLSGAKISATDLRAGAAFVIAGLIAEGTTEIDNIQHIYRGYVSMETKMKNLGAKIVRI
ncbi:UDP-N-acetylglucosamine 1-carboxyvinyltransferase [Clostridiaceae bacterium M8S5]|nr:UDP-N-acetylglucosamine 1-carboxyvinyltransferase [Clostridiaceae bacterium M8S5]